MKKNGRHGFTLTELIVGLGIFVLLLAFLLASFNQARAQIKVGRAKAAITQYAYLLEVMKGELNYYPPDINNTLESLTYSTAPAGYERRWRGPYLKEIPVDPWKTPYFYRLRAGTFLPRWIVDRNTHPGADSYLTFDAGEYGGSEGSITMLNILTSGTANRIWLNGVEIISPDEFKQHVSEVQKDVTFLPTGTPNVIRAKLLGNPNSQIGIDIGSFRHPRTTYSVGSYGSDKTPGGIRCAQDPTWVTGQGTPTF